MAAVWRSRATRGLTECDARLWARSLSRGIGLPIEPEMEATWTRDELIRWVTGKQLYGRDAQALTVDLPDWLLTASDGLGPGDDSAEALETTHPEDRNVLIGSFIEALGQPGQLMPGRLRGLYEDRWITTEIEWLNLLDHPDVGALVCAIVEVEAAPVVPMAVSQSGDHRATAWMLLDVNTEGIIRSVEGRVGELIGYDAADLVDHLLTEFLHNDTVADSVANWMAVRNEIGATSTSRRPWVHRDGTHIWLESSYLNRGGGSIMSVVWDITERRAQEQELADLTAQFRLLADEVPSPVFCCDADGAVLFHNARWAELAAARSSVASLHDLIDEADAGALGEALAELAVGAHADRRLLDVRSREGGAVWRLSLRSTGDHESGRATIVGSIDDMTEAVRLQQEARHDVLTGLLNRQGLEERLERAVASAPESTLVVFVDLDDFKEVNDTFGHDAGDAVLVEVGHRLAGALRPHDAVARYGGDEFVAVCEGVTDGDEYLILSRLEGALNLPVSFDGGVWDAGASVGVARPGPEGEASTVLRRADLAMFHDKRRRKGDRLVGS